MKTLKKLLLALLVLLVIYLLLCLIGPKRMEVQKSTEIKAPAGVVFEQINNLNNWEGWSPWVESDTTTKITLGEKTVGLGANYSWTSEQGNGKLEIIESDGKSIKTKMSFDDWEGNSFGLWNLEEGEDGNTKLSWGMTSNADTPFIFRGMMMVNGMKKNLEKNFAKGLSNIKTIAEKSGAIVSAVKVRKEVVAERHFLTNRKKIKMTELKDFYTENLPALFQAVISNGIQPAGMPCGIYYKWDETKGEVDLAAGVPLMVPVEKLGNYKGLSLAAGEALIVDHYGPYEGIGSAHWAIDEYAKSNNLKVKDPIVEDYMNDPTTVSADSIHTRVSYYLN